MNDYQSAAHTFALSVNAASALLSLGVPIRKLDPITRELDGDHEITRFWFEGNSQQFGKANSLLHAYTILAKGKFDPTKPTSDEVISILNNNTHIIHQLHSALTTRDELHKAALEIIKTVKPILAPGETPDGFYISDTAAAAAISIFSNEKPKLYYQDVMLRLSGLRGWQ